jgi:hypothetical protein
MTWEMDSVSPRFHLAVPRLCHYLVTFLCSARVMRKIFSYLLTCLLVDFISDYFGSWELFPKVKSCAVCMREFLAHDKGPVSLCSTITMSWTIDSDKEDVLPHPMQDSKLIS